MNKFYFIIYINNIKIIGNNLYFIYINFHYIHISNLRKKLIILINTTYFMLFSKQTKIKNNKIKVYLLN